MSDTYIRAWKRFKCKTCGEFFEEQFSVKESDLYEQFTEIVSQPCRAIHTKCQPGQYLLLFDKSVIL